MHARSHAPGHLSARDDPSAISAANAGDSVSELTAEITVEMAIGHRELLVELSGNAGEEGHRNEQGLLRARLLTGP